MATIPGGVHATAKAEAMQLSQFRASLEDDTPPGTLSLPVLALWYLAKGDWEEAHRQAQDDKGNDGAWVHAHLHRVEGDLSNAAYWYRRAGKEASSLPLDKEWDEIATALLEQS
jgi:hypothetical protein